MKGIKDYKEIERLLSTKMDELIGPGDYRVGYSRDGDRFMVSFREGDIGSSCDMADEVVDWINVEETRLRVGNCGAGGFWLTWSDK